MLAPEFVEAEVREWIDGYPAIDKLQREILIELAKRIIASYEYYRREVSRVNE